MREFDERLHECLEALREGRWDLDECLRRNPEHAADLRPLLVAASAAMHAYGVQPRAEFAKASRERFLIASGERLREALDVEPSPSFFASARVRFLLAAQRLRAERAAERRAPRRIPVFGSPFRALATGLASVALFLGFSTYTVATANASVPGDWQYPVKLQTERVRLALAFGDEAEREVKLDFAEERVQEIETLARRGKIIGPGVLDRLKDQTEPLVRDASDGGWDSDDAARLQEVAAKQTEVLEAVEPNVSAEAQDKLDEAKGVSEEGVKIARQILVQPDIPLVIPAERTLTPTPVAPTPTSTVPAATPTAGDGSTPVTGATPPAVETVPSLPPDPISVGATPVASLGDVEFVQVIAGRLKLLIPREEDGWVVLDNPRLAVPTIMKIGSPDGALGADGSSLIAFNTGNGDMYWYVNRNGLIHEVQLRITTGDTTLIADETAVRDAFGAAAEVPLYILGSIEVAPDPTPTPSPTPPADAPAE